MIELSQQPDNMKRKTLKGLFETVMLVGGSQVLRFGSNLILTRLLFPEAFGLMALVQVILMGVEMLTAFGVTASVIQSPRGDDPKFLHTAWTLQVIRGLILWVALFFLTPLFAQIYKQPELALVLPFASLSIILTALGPAKAMTVQRHMNLGRFSALKLISQAVSLVVMIAFAYVLESVWALVIGNIVQASLLMVLFRAFLPGPPDRFALEKESAFEILSFGKFLFVSSFATFTVGQGDRAILGLFLPIDLLGVYGIGFALASLPLIVMSAVTNSVIFPLYRMRHPSENKENRANIFNVRRLVTGGGIAIVSIMAITGPWLIDILYDDRYALAGPITVILCAANVPLVLFNGTMHAALAKGDAYRFMLMNVASAVAQTVLLWGLVSLIGIVGAAIAMGIAPLLTYPLLAYFLRKYDNWDVIGDAALLTVGFGITFFACWLHWDAIIALP